MQAARKIKSIGISLPAGVAPRGKDAAVLVRALLTAAPSWELGAMGPTAFDCWSMNQLIQYHLFGRKVMVVKLDDDAGIHAIRRAVAAHPANAQWHLHDGEPQHGDAVKMAHITDPFHIGTYLAIDRGLVLHHTESTGVCIDTLTQLRGRGYRNIRFHSWIGGAT